MTTTITEHHQMRFEEIKRNLTSIGYKEGTFLKVELLFYEALSISRAYGNDSSQNKLLADLQRLQEAEYSKTKEHTRKSRQRELRIRQFVVQFKKILSFR